MTKPYIEISKHELAWGDTERNKSFLWFCYKQFIRLYPSESIMGDNIVMMRGNDYYELRTKAEAYEKLSQRS
jgi:hypothetical protein